MLEINKIPVIIIFLIEYPLFNFFLADLNNPFFITIINTKNKRSSYGKTAEPIIKGSGAAINKQNIKIPLANFILFP